MAVSTSPASVPSVTERTVREKPILFSGSMVKALLDGRKTMTRRVVKPQPPDRFRVGWVEGDAAFWSEKAVGDFPMWEKFVTCPYGQPGDRLWVRETWADDTRGDFLYRADPFFDGAEIAWKWKPSILMPRRASRITLEITDVRVEQLNDISESDARREGVEPIEIQPDAIDEREAFSFTHGFIELWDSINASRGYGWDANPYVWAITFRVVHPHERLGDA